MLKIIELILTLLGIIVIGIFAILVFPIALIVSKPSKDNETEWKSGFS